MNKKTISLTVLIIIVMVITIVTVINNPQLIKQKNNIPTNAIILSPSPILLEIEPTKDIIVSTLIYKQIKPYQQYKGFSLAYDKSWTYKESINESGQTITLKKNDSQITIARGNLGGESCVVAEQNDFDQTSSIHYNPKQASTITNNLGKFVLITKSIPSSAISGIIICGPSYYPGDDFLNTLTPYGNFSVEYSGTLTEQTLNKIKVILQSLSVI